MGEEGVNLERESESDVCGIVMDTPDRRQFTSPGSKFEDSPVFNYLNSLSPIKPVKSIHITQTFNSLTFSSPPSVFTSPHVSSLKDSKLRRHQYRDSSKPELSSNHGGKGGKSEEATEVAHNSEQQQSYDQGSIASESSALLIYESSDAVVLPQTLSYESVSPDCNRTSHICIENKIVPELAGSSSDLVLYAQIDSGKESLGKEVHVEGTSHINENKDATGCDWENLFSDEGDLLLFDTPNESKSLMDPGQRSLEHGMSLCASLTGDLQNSRAVNTVGLSEQHEADNNSSHIKGRHDMKVVKGQDILVSRSNTLAGDTSGKVNNQITSNLHRGMRRRCLVFEMVGSRRKPLEDTSDCGSSMLSQSIDNAASNDKCVLSLNLGNDNPRRILPGIGLHLNALAATSVDHKYMKSEAATCGGQPISVSGPTAYNNLSNSQQVPNNLLVVPSLDRDIRPVVDGAPTAEAAAQGSGFMVNEMLNRRSPKKKRRRLGNDGESEACKRCNCKKSKCLKLYCECFAAGVYCVEPCSCQECFNTPIHEDTVLATRKQIESRNPLAFAPKVIRNSDSIIEIGEESSNTPASARHKRGCNCKKSGCLKKYCECYQGGVGCSINCRCEGCKNAFGRKDGAETELEDDEAEKVDDLEGGAINRSLKITRIENDVEQNTNFTLPATPLKFGSQSIQPFSSKSKKPPRSSFLFIGGSSSGIYGTPRFGKLNPLLPRAKFQNDQKDEMPEILQQNASPNSGVKSASPNSKRVSPPHCNIGLSPRQRSSRKLILQSIPSFPSLTPKH